MVEMLADGTGMERRKGARHIWFLNSAFDRIGMDIAVRRVAERPARQPFAYVVTPNVDHLVRLETDTVLARLYAQAWLTVCDSRVLELLGRASGEDIEVTPGSDLTRHLFENEIDPDDAINVVGGSRDVIEAVRERYGRRRRQWRRRRARAVDYRAQVAQARADIGDGGGEVRVHGRRRRGDGVECLAGGAAEPHRNQRGS